MRNLKEKLMELSTEQLRDELMFIDQEVKIAYERKEVYEEYFQCDFAVFTEHMKKGEVIDQILTERGGGIKAS